MLNGPFALALTAGMAATVNPCGFALLPAYLSAFVGLDDSAARTTAVARGMKVSLVLTAGFIAVFGIFGLVISGVASELQRYLPWATIVIGIGLVGLGIYLLTGRQIMLNIPKLQKGGADGTLLSMFLFGVSYAVASLSCTIGPFLAVTSTTFRNENYLSGVMVFVLYGLGMGLVVSVLTMAVALAKDGMVAKFRSLLPKMNKIAGVLLVIAGFYVAYYGYYEVQLFFFDGELDDPIIDAGESVQSWLQGLMPDTGNYWQWVIGALVLLGAGIGWTAYRSRRSAAADEPDPLDPSDVSDVETV
ncbi:MAG: cytochrome c biogenesis CcdA family protein [Ilumatobacter fluminis]|uniref:Cytochrome c biogenesis protein CcdA n=1 Tax=Ilumatobacter fluminis TaxID=467091 RepID=A0A4R7I2N2_9ACTN|nr:cytochrome c biogenesis CcdA family protein [Ilumatobacter fluminis]TDT17480.1 cytochrome c biogenesis protein CcdA [Ilumatobacter fluminis]